MKYLNPLTLLCAFLGPFLWVFLNFSALEKEIAVLKTVLIIKNVYPRDLEKEYCNETKRRDIYRE